MKKWVCTVCGYVYEGENAPEKWTIEKTELRLYPLTKTLAKAQKA